jgi:hypothetical protein
MGLALNFFPTSLLQVFSVSVRSQGDGKFNKEGQITDRVKGIPLLLS